MQQTAEVQRRAVRITAAALATGPALFLGVAFFLRAQPDGMGGTEPSTAFLTPASGGAALLAVVAHFVLSARLPGAPDFARLRGLLLVRQAVVEGAALLACVAYLLEGNLTAAGVVAAMVLWMLVMQFPTHGRLEEWTDSHTKE